MSTLCWESVVAQCNQNSWTLWFLVGYRLLFLIILFFLQDWLNSACTSFHWGYWSIFSTQWVLFQGHSSSTSWTHAASLHNVNYESANNRFALMVIICSHNEMLTFWKMSSRMAERASILMTQAVRIWCLPVSLLQLISQLDIRWSKDLVLKGKE